MKLIKFRNHTLKILNNGTIFWPKKSISIVADLHLEKSSFFAKHGFYIPPYDSYETLLNLKKNLKGNNIKILIFLGDLFHDNEGYERLDQKTKLIFNEIIKKYEIIFIRGNHDSLLTIPNVKSHQNILIDGISFSHEPRNTLYEICGHLHPKISLSINGRNISKKCFIVSKYKIFMPAFGCYTGGLNIKSSAFQKYIKNYNLTYYIIGEKLIYELKNF